MIKQGQSGIQVDETSRTSGFQVTSGKEKEEEKKKRRWGVKDFYSRIIEAVNVKCDLGIGRKIQLLYIALNLYIAASLV